MFEASCLPIATASSAQISNESLEIRCCFKCAGPSRSQLLSKHLTAADCYRPLGDPAVTRHQTWCYDGKSPVVDELERMRCL